MPFIRSQADRDGHSYNFVIMDYPVEMKACPHCHKPAFSAGSAVLSSRSFPLKCPHCGGRSFLDRRRHGATLVLLELMPWAVAIALLWFGQLWLAVIAFFVAIGAGQLWLGYQQELTPITARQIMRARLLAAFLLLLFIGASVLGMLSWLGRP